MNLKNILKKLLNNDSGIGLVETLLALGIGVIVITSLVSLAIFTVRASLQSNLGIEGSQLANQEIELIRAYRDSNPWATFTDALSANGCYGAGSTCRMDSVTVISSGVKTVGTGAKQIEVSFYAVDLNGDQSVIRIAVTASWMIGSETKYAYNYTDLTNWRSQ